MRVELSPTLDFGPRIRWAARLLAFGFLLLVLRLWYLQILEGKRYYAISTSNHIRIRPLPAPRGLILDRNGEVLVENRAAFDVLLNLQDIPDIERAASEISKVLGMEPEEVKRQIEAAQEKPSGPLILKKGIDEPTLTAIEERKLDLPGLAIQVRPVRAYPEGGIAALLLGYVREVSKAQLMQDELQDLRPGDHVGQAGIERSYDAFIRGIDGGEQVEVDALGRVVRLLGRLEPKSGFNLYLTIDRRIQQAAEEAFQGKAGAAIAIDPRTGEVLAFVSRPSYDPNFFTQSVSPEDWQKLIADPKHPLQNRPLRAVYPPGSIFKLVTALAGLESGAITPETKFTCPGSFSLGNKSFACWKKGGHGTLDLQHAIAKSCNVYFYNVALRTGAEWIAWMARELGLGRSLGIELGEEARGFIPNLDGNGKETWYSGNTVMLGIGQGAVAVTPFQVLSMVAAIANGGTIYRPSFVKRVESLDGEIIEEYGSEAVRRVNVGTRSLAIVRQGMWAVVNDGGTGGLARLPDVAVAGKTGTAQVARKAVSLASDLKDHAWFVAFAPYENPRIALGVIVEHGGMGGRTAAPVARAMLKAALKVQTEPWSAAQEANPQEIGD